MANPYFQFKQFTIRQDRCAMKVTTDACLFGAWVAERVLSSESLVLGQAEAGRNMLDIGTGTGLLSLMLAQKNSTLHIDAIEIDKAAAEQAQENTMSSPWSSRIQVGQSDAVTVSYDRQYAIIISNPPFYENELKGNNPQKNLAHHNEGLLLTSLLNIIRINLHPGGKFYLLLPYKRKNEIQELIAEQGLSISQLVFVRQSVNHDFFRIMLEGTIGRNDTIATPVPEIAIKDGTDHYTSDFVHLLKEYYLYL